MAVVAFGGVVLGDVSEVSEVISILAGAVDIADLMFADQLLINKFTMFVLKICMFTMWMTKDRTIIKK